MDVVAEVGLRDLDAGELGLVLVQVLDLVLADGRLDRDRRQRVCALSVDLAGELPRGDAENGSQSADERISPLLRHVAHLQLNGRPRDVRDDDASVTIEDRPARGVDPHDAQLVVLGGVEVARPGEHLQ